MPRVIRDLTSRVSKKYAKAKPRTNRITQSQQVEEASRLHTLEYVRATLIRSINELQYRYRDNSDAMALLWRVKFTLTEVDIYEDEDEHMNEDGDEDEYEYEHDDEEGGVSLQ